MRAAAYIRVSSEEQASEGVSLDNQRLKIQGYCMVNDIRLIEVIEDAGRSAKDTNRPGLQRLLTLVKGKAIDSVIVYKLDRLSRRVIDVLTLVESFEKAGVAFHSLNERIDTSTAMGRFFLNIMASLAQMERDQLAERTRDAMRHMKMQGLRVGSIPFGFCLASDGEHLIANPDEQKAIVRIKTLNASGLSFRRICSILAVEGYRPREGLWHHQKISNVLKTVD